MERKRLTQGRKKVWEKRFQWALFPAVLLFLLALILPERPVGSRRGAWRGARTLIGPALIWIFCSLAPGAAEAGLFSSPVKQGIEAWEKKAFNLAKKAFIDAQLESPDDLRLYYNIGTAAYGAGDWDLAASNFIQAAESGDARLRHNAMFNLANTRYRQGDLSQAIKDYERLLKEFPDDVQARENLEFVKQKQAQARQEQEKDQSRNKGKEPDNKDQNNKDPDNKDGNGEQEDTAGREKDDQSRPNKNDRDQSDRGESDPDRPDNQDREDRHPDGKQSEDSGAPGGEDRKGQAPMDGDPENQEGNPEDNRQSPGEAAAATPGRKDGTDAALSPAEAALLENRLNRLADKPGMALIPRSGARKNDKDW